MTYADGQVYDAAGANAALGLIAPQSATLAALYTPTGSFADIGLSITVTCGGTSEVYEVTACLDVTMAAATASTVSAALVADGVGQTGQIIATADSANHRMPGMKKWHVTGLAAGSRVFKIQAMQTGGSWRINATHSALHVKRVG